jgi:hypothetical protein
MRNYKLIMIKARQGSPVVILELSQGLGKLRGSYIYSGETPTQW